VTDLRANRWQLPDGVNELLPEDAWRVETLRRLIMDNSWRWGYELVMPPMIEYLDSLLTGTGEKLDLQTFKIIDQHNGRSLGVRADMTPQVARMDAHALQKDVPNRLFYTGSVLRARTDGAGSSRTPLQFGAELFGHPGPQSDAETIHLMVDNIQLAGCQPGDLMLDVGHVGVYRALIGEADNPADLEKSLFDALIRGSYPEVDGLLRTLDESPETKLFCKHIRALMQLRGDCTEVLAKAHEQLSGCSPRVQSALENLHAVIDSVRSRLPDLPINIDLAELRGYSYHTGILFTLYDTQGVKLATGGRYDAIGEAFGRARPATGFSADLVGLALMHASGKLSQSDSGGIWAAVPDTALNEPDIAQLITDLRKSGERVVLALPGSTMQPSDCGCDRQLIRQNERWTVESL